MPLTFCTCRTPCSNNCASLPVPVGSRALDLAGSDRDAYRCYHVPSGPDPAANAQWCLRHPPPAEALGEPAGRRRLSGATVGGERASRGRRSATWIGAGPTMLSVVVVVRALVHKVYGVAAFALSATRGRGQAPGLDLGGSRRAIHGHWALAVATSVGAAGR